MRGSNPDSVNYRSGRGFLHGDHLGSVSVATDNDRRVVSRQDYTPWGEARGGDITQTTLDFTCLLYYGARYYDPALGCFLSADSIVPGRASGQGGMAATLGQDGGAALRPLTVDFHENAFSAGLAREDAFTQAKGFRFQLSGQDRQQGEGAKWQWGPQNPQALNRYCYALNNPLRYTDPTGHFYDDNWLSGSTTGYSRVCSDGASNVSCDTPGSTSVTSSSGAYLYHVCVQSSCKYVWGDDPAWGNLRGQIDTFVSSIVQAEVATGIAALSLLGGLVLQRENGCARVVVGS